MPKSDGLDAKVRKAMLADETDPESEPRDIAPTPIPNSHTPEPVPVVAAPVAPQVDVTQLIQMLAAAMQQSGANTAQAIKDGLADGMSLARDPIPENKIAPGFSVYAHPEGDQRRPRTKLRCPMYLGAYNEYGHAIGVFEIFQDTCKESERVMLNQLTPGDFTVYRNDDKHAIWKVVEEKDSLGQVTRLVIAVPTGWLSKEEQAQMPSQTRFLKQLTAPAEAAA